MPDQEISAEPTSVSTSAVEPSVEQQDSNSEPNPLDDWGKPEGDPKPVEEPKTDPEPKPVEEPAKPAEKPAPAEKEAEKETDGEPKSEEDEVLEELFSDESKDESKAEKPKAEEKKPEELDDLDAQEQINLQRNKTAKAWAERRDKRAKYVDDFMYDKPIEEVAQRFEELNKERFTELRRYVANSLVDENPEGAIQRAFVVAKLRQDPNFDWQNAELPKLTDILNGPAALSRPVLSDDVKAVTKELADLLEIDWRDPANDVELLDDRERAMVKALRALEAAPKPPPETEAELKAAKDRIAELEGKVQSKSSEERATGLEKEVTEFRSSVEQKMLPFILKNTGLEISKDDTPEITQVKKDLAIRYTGTEYERANGLETPFETFAYHESSVSGPLSEMLVRIITAKEKAYDARVAGDKKAAEDYAAAVEYERVPLYTLLATANKEFKEKHIVPYLKAIGGSLSAPVKQIKEASERVEVVDSGGEAPSKGKKREYTTAEAVWGGMVEESAEEEKLRAAA